MPVLHWFDPWKNPLCTCPKKYSLDPYTGCSHKCLYCYASSYRRYIDSKPKKDFLIKLEKDLLKADKRFYISMSNSSDPYPPIEEKKELTRKTLELIKKYKFKVLIVTKSNLVTRDIDLLKNIKSSVSITITTLNKRLAKRLEPGAPNPDLRLKAVEELTRNDIPVSVRIDPILPFINDDEGELRELVREVVYRGAKHIVTSTYKAKPDNFKRVINEFPELKDKYYELYYKKGEYKYGSRYLPLDLRKKLLFPIIDGAKRLGVSYAVCREGIKEYFNAKSCDGSHLIKY